MSRPGFSEFQKSMCKFVPDFKWRCVRDDPFLCWQNIGAGKYRTSRRLRPFSAQFQMKDDICMAPQGITYMSKLKNTPLIVASQVVVYRCCFFLKKWPEPMYVW